MDREQLYSRIDARVDAIVAAGAEDEVRRAEARGPSHTARKALGFTELLEGDVDRMKQRSRNYARRQMTWMRKMPNVRAIDQTCRSQSPCSVPIRFSPSSPPPLRRSAILSAASRVTREYGSTSRPPYTST